VDGVGISFAMTTGIRLRMANDRKFAASVMRAMKRFANKDWGTVDMEDRQTNDQMDSSLNLGGGGMVLGAYNSEKKNKIWIIRDAERITILFPDEY
jgi:hypothetical protein